jgi:hypothetical protein
VLENAFKITAGKALDQDPAIGADTDAEGLVAVLVRGALGGPTGA